MTNYTNTFGGAAKDAAKDIILGADYDTEYDAIVTHIATKANIAAPSFTGTVTSAGDIVTDATIQALGDTASNDKAAMGYTSAEGLILTGQGSVTDIILKNDADATILSVDTGTTVVDFVSPPTIGGLVLKPEVKDHGTKSGNYTVQLDEAELHLVTFSATATLTIASSYTNDKATVVVKNGNFVITLSGIDNDSPTLTQASSKQDFIGLVKSFGKITAVASHLNIATT